MGLGGSGWLHVMGVGPVNKQGDYQMTIRKLLLSTSAAAAIASVMMIPVPASANAFCDSKVAPYRGELEAKVNPALAEIDNGIAGIRKGGGDPDKIAIKMKDGTFKTLPELRNLLLTQKVAVSKEIDDAGEKCTNDLKPFQDTTDAAVTLATGGLNKLLPERMTHIEIGEILAGKPFGGDGGLVPHFREQVLGTFGLKDDHGFVTTVIRDPLHAVFPHW
jgi:hypothetical protein